MKVDAARRSVAPSAYMHAVRGSFIAPTLALGLLAVLLSLSATASAQAPCVRCSTADASDALPGLGTSAVPQLQRAVSATFVGGGSYGVNVDPIGPGSLHHRMSGSIAGAVHVVPWLAIGLRMNGRYDLVTSSGGRSDDGLFGYPTLALRLSAEPISGLTIGLDAQAMVFGAEAPSFEFGSTSALFRALGAYAIELGGARLVLLLNIGYFLDNSRAAAPRGVTDNLSAEDRLSLGVSDTGAIVASLGAAYVAEGLDVYGEVSSRIYTDGSVIGSSPLRVGVGARFWLAPEVFFLGIGADVRVTPQSAALVGTGTMPNAPVEPALSLLLSAGVRIGAETPADEVVDVVDEADEPDDETTVVPAVATAGVALGRVLEGEAAVAGANVELTSDGDASVRTATTGDDGRWRIADVPLGGAHFRITSEGRDPVEGTITIVADAPVETTSSMSRALPQGEIRGVIQANNGQPIAARIVIRPIGRELTADAEGSFAIEVPPGEYDVEVSAAGHRTQSRHVTVAEQGVVVLNVQLRAGRGR